MPSTPTAVVLVAAVWSEEVEAVQATGQQTEGVDEKKSCCRG